MAWFNDNSEGRLHAVAELPANSLGLHDTHGNVDEWCQDRWHRSYDGAPGDGSAWEAASAVRRVYRGGRWYGTAGGCRSAHRSRGEAGIRSFGLGFRPARSLP